MLILCLKDMGESKLDLFDWIFLALMEETSVNGSWRLFTYFETQETHKLDIATFHMERKALTWYQWLKKSNPVTTWGDFLVALHTRFGPSTYEDLVGAFTKLKQTRSVEEYEITFEVLSNKINGVSEEFRISTFLGSLREKLRIIVTMFKPTTLSTAFGLARLQEENVTKKMYPYQTYPTPNSPHFPTLRDLPP